MIIGYKFIVWSQAASDLVIVPYCLSVLFVIDSVTLQWCCKFGLMSMWM